MTDRDPYSRSEDEGIPDLQEGTPERFWASDPQEEALPGDEPVALDDYGTTNEEQRTDEPLDRRLRREVPDVQPVFGDADIDELGGIGGIGQDEDEDLDSDNSEEERSSDDSGQEADLDTRYERDNDIADDWPDYRAGRLVEPDQGVRPDTESAAVADDVGADSGGYSSEEAAMHIQPELPKPERPEPE